MKPLQRVRICDFANFQPNVCRVGCINNFNLATVDSGINTVQIDVSRDRIRKRDIQHTLDVPDKRSAEQPTQPRQPLPSLRQDSLNTIDLAACWRSSKESYRKCTDSEAATAVSSYSVTTARSTNSGTVPPSTRAVTVV